MSVVVVTRRRRRLRHRSACTGCTYYMYFEDDLPADVLHILMIVKNYSTYVVVTVQCRLPTAAGSVR